MHDYNQDRGLYIRILFIAIPLLILIRLLFLQVFGVGGYKQAALTQAVYRKVVHPARGVLYDRKNEVILNNSIVYDLVIEPKKIAKDFDTLLLCKFVGVTIEDFRIQCKKVILKNGWDKATPIYKNLSTVTIARLFENLSEFHGVDLVEHTERSFPYNCGGIFTGYINEITESQLQNEKYASYIKGDYLGITGLEYEYEELLRGKPGVSYLLRDVKQRIQGSYKNGEMDTISEAGKPLQLYIDVKLQQLTEKLMQGKLGAAVAIDPKTGGILTMVSAPTFDPGLLTGADKGKNFYKIFTDATKPLFNRAIRGAYPPGSTFKTLTALVGLDEGVITPQYGYPCGGGYYSCGRRIGCTHSGGGHAANLGSAIANSCNSYFCHIFRLSIDAPKHGGTHKGLQAWTRHMYNFGLGHPIGVDIPSELGGSIPDSNYFNKVYNKSWNSCNMSIIGMGQGEILLTPLQMANSMCIVANKGYYYIPHFVKAVDGDSTHQVLQKYLEKHKTGNIDDYAYEAVMEGMEAVVDRGTAKNAKIPGIRICAKTGTAQNERMVMGKKVKLQNHSMFVAFAPRENPRICIAVAVENGGYGATWAGAIASLMIEQYLTDSIKPARKALVSKMENAKLIPNITYVIDSLERIKAKENDIAKNYGIDSLNRWREGQEQRRRTEDSIREVKEAILERELTIKGIKEDSIKNTLKKKADLLKPKKTDTLLSNKNKDSLIKKKPTQR
jgi:penicillin-binding protein 2